MEQDSYKNADARNSRWASLTTKQLLSEFGDPSSGDFQDPYADTNQGYDTQDVSGHSAEQPTG